MPMFDRSGRYPQLTEEGKALLNEARTVVYGMDAFKARARTMFEGLEPELSMAIDVMYPMASLTDAVGSFRNRSPNTPLRLYVEALGTHATRRVDPTSGARHVAVDANLPAAGSRRGE